LLETIDLLRSFHHRAPFFFFNGNTFADIGRQLTTLVLADLSTPRRRQASSAVAHCIAGVLDRDSMIAIMESLCESASFQPGDRIKTLRGSTHGVVVRVRPDGKIVWTPDGSRTELIALPESLLREGA
jgi:hypothetical protein